MYSPPIRQKTDTLGRELASFLTRAWAPREDMASKLPPAILSPRSHMKNSWGGLDGASLPSYTYCNRERSTWLLNEERKFTFAFQTARSQVCFWPLTTKCTYIWKFYGTGDKTPLGRVPQVIIFWWFKNKLTELFKDTGTKAKWKRKLKWEKGSSLQQKDFPPQVISVFRVSGFAGRLH